MNKKLEIREHVSVLGGTWRTVYWNGEGIGAYEVVNGGFIPVGCRKVMLNEKDAQYRVIQRKIARHLKEAAELGRLLEAVGAE